MNQDRATMPFQKFLDGCREHLRMDAETFEFFEFFCREELGESIVKSSHHESVVIEEASKVRQRFVKDVLNQGKRKK